MASMPMHVMAKSLQPVFMSQVHEPDLSFEAAMLNLGGSVLGFAECRVLLPHPKVKVFLIRSVIISCYADICAMRHPKEGAPLVASQKSRIPVINAGDGGHQHPTQTLTDLIDDPFFKGTDCPI